jgi:hypothetical protein
MVHKCALFSVGLTKQASVVKTWEVAEVAVVVAAAVGHEEESADLPLADEEESLY